MPLDPLPLSQTVTPFSTPSPSSVTYFMDGPSAEMKMKILGKGIVLSLKIKMRFFEYRNFFRNRDNELKYIKLNLKKSFVPKCSKMHMKLQKLKCGRLLHHKYAPSPPS